MLNDLKIVLLAGKGERFLNKGYTVPKGLLKFNDLEIAIHSANSIPKCAETIFGLQIKDYKNYDIQNTIEKKYRENYNFYKFENYTIGQATSCYEIVDKLNLRSDKSFFLLSCDFSFTVKEKKLKEIIDDKFDAIVFTYKAKEINYSNPLSFGWTRSDENNFINKVACKKRIDPHQNNDYIVIGAFHFTKKNTYVEYYKKLIKEKRYVNDETYIDVIIEMMVDDGLRVYNYEVDSFKNFGTPEQYELEKRNLQ